MMVQCLKIGWMVSLSQPLRPHLLFLLYVTSVRGKDHSIVYRFTVYCSWHLHHVWQIISDLGLVFTTVVLHSETMGGAPNHTKYQFLHNVALMKWLHYHHLVDQNETNLLIASFIFLAQMCEIGWFQLLFHGDVRIWFPFFFFFFIKSIVIWISFGFWTIDQTKTRLYEDAILRSGKSETNIILFTALYWTCGAL